MQRPLFLGLEAQRGLGLVLSAQPWFALQRQPDRGDLGLAAPHPPREPLEWGALAAGEQLVADVDVSALACATESGKALVAVATGRQLLYKSRIESIRKKMAGEVASAEQEKTITLVSVDDIARTRRWLGAWAIAHQLKVLSFEEHRGRLTHELRMTVVGHPTDIREFHDDVRGDAWTAESGGDLFDAFVTPIVVSGLRSARRKWQGRHDPPRSSEVRPTDGSRTVLYWKWEEAGDDGGGFGPVWVDRYERGSVEPDSSEEWSQWARRADAVAYAREHGFTFLPDE